MVRSYVEGIYWVLTYYHAGCGSWTWYYPYLYAPLASDLVNLAELDVKLDAGEPFTPLLQLLSVLPAQSSKLLPPAYAEIMTTPESPLSEFYPPDFAVDLNGKRNDWECVVCIPFIEEGLLLDVVSGINHTQALSRSERLRNIPGTEHSFRPANAPANARSGKGKGPGRSRAAVDLRDGGTWGNALVDSRMANRINNQRRGSDRSQGSTAASRRVWTSKKAY